MKAEVLETIEELNLIKLARDYSDEDKARELLEELRWPNGPVCPHCKATKVYRLKPSETSKVRKGLCKCAKCRKQFTVTVGTVFEDSHIPISKWLQAVFLLCSSKKAISAHQLHRMLGTTYKTAWFMAHRIRYAMGNNPDEKPFTGTVEIDETYVGGKPRKGEGVQGRGTTSKTPVVALVKRDGSVRTKVVANVTQKNLGEFVAKNIAKGTIVNTDCFPTYKPVLWDITKYGTGGDHRVINHSKHYAKPHLDGSVTHVNTCESFFSLLKRGVYGAFHHVSEDHLHRYCDEFSFRWNNRKVTDGQRTANALQAIEGKRLTYRQAR